MARFVPVLVAVGAGVALAAASYLADQVQIDGENPNLVLEAIARLGNAPSPWIAAAFGTGIASRRVATGALAGITALAIGVTGYYVLLDISGDREGVDLQRVAMAWLFVGAVCGLVFGGAGAAWQTGGRRLRLLSAALLGGALGGIGLYAVMDMAPYWPASRREVVLGAGHLVAGLVVAAALVRGFPERAWVFAASAALSLGGAACTLIVLDQMRERFNA